MTLKYGSGVYGKLHVFLMGDSPAYMLTNITMGAPATNEPEAGGIGLVVRRRCQSPSNYA